MKRTLITILLLPALLGVAVLLPHVDKVLNVVLGPIDDPSFFCQVPDPSPPEGLSATVTLQECTAGKTVTIVYNVSTGTQITFQMGGEVFLGRLPGGL